jgi:hypothetical protein
MYRPKNPSFGIQHFFKERLSEPAKPGEKIVPNIYNLDEYFKTNKNSLFNREYYLRCKTFIDNIISKTGDELDSNTGNILDLHINPEYQSVPDNSEILSKMTEIKELYRKLYLDGLQPVNHQIIREGQIYPDYYEDLYFKNYKPYEKLESELGIPDDITKQTDEQFLETLKKRVEGLQNCIDKQEGQMPGSDEYFKKEHSRESKTSTTNKTETELIEEKCKAIYYSQDMLEASEKIQTDETFFDVLAKYEKFFKDPREVAYARTFLPDTSTNTYFLADGNIDMKKIAELIKSNNRDLRQFVFGFFSDSPEFEYLKPLRPFLYEIGGIQISSGNKVSCSPLVNWSLLLNLLYCRCSIMNAEVPFPVRFILPNLEYTKVGEPRVNNDGNLVRQIVIRNRLGLVDLFDNNVDSNAKFVGIITIKYNFKNKSGGESLRVWFLFVFKNNNISHNIADRRDLITGQNHDYFITNSFLQFVNMGSIAERHNITHTELTFFVSMYKKKQVYFYCTNRDENNIFISRQDNLEQDKYFKDKLGLYKVHIEIKEQTAETIKPEHFFASKVFQIIYMKNIGNTPTSSNLEKSIQTGGMNKLHNDLKIQTTSRQDIYYNNDFSNIHRDVSRSGMINFYNEYLEVSLKIRSLVRKDGYRKLIYAFSKLYNYHLLEPLNSTFEHEQILKTKKDKNISIAKYIPISRGFFAVNEMLKTFNIFNKLSKDTRIQYVGPPNFSFIEVLKYNDYKINNIDILITAKSIYYKTIMDEWKTYIDNIKKIYNLNIQNHNDSIYNLIQSSKSNASTNIESFDIIYYASYVLPKGISELESYYNTTNIYIGMLYGLQKLNKHGTFILYFGSLAYKHLEDIYIILSNYFETSNLFYPEISNLYKKSGLCGVFQNFKGCDPEIMLKLIDMLDEIKKIYPNDGEDFNINDMDVRKELIITKQIDPSLPKQKIITRFLNISNSTDKHSHNNHSYNHIRKYISQFNNERYIKQLSFCTKLLNYITVDKSILDAIKFPTQEQIVNSILYCNKWGIEYWDKYSSKPFLDKFGRIIMSETYGLHQPIIYHFKTPFKFHTVRKLTLKLDSKHTKQSNKNRITKKTRSNKTTKTHNTAKSSIDKLFDINDFIKDIKSNKYKSQKSQKSQNLELMPELDYSNNRLHQAGYLIDSRRDLTKSITGNIDLQNTKWWEVNKQFRYYKHKDDMEKMHLDEVVRKKLNDSNISQAWLKMYEIITDCNLVSKNKKGTFHSFHICEVPGTFINCINNYIHTKTQYSNYEWHSQSLNPKIARIKDQFGLIRRHPDRWDYGADQTGDITKVKNIDYYKKQVSQRPPIQLMTSDCGLSMKDEGYEKVAFASLLAILHILPVDGTMVYKILTPIDEPLILNLVYIAYCNFKELVFYKPVQNNHSREFYIIGKGYLGTEPKILEKFFNVLKMFNTILKDKDDLFDDKYPEAFVRQFVDISNHLADNYIYTIERNIYYLDNFENMTPEFIKLMKDYYDEKNQDWIDKYNPRRMESDIDKL